MIPQFSPEFFDAVVCNFSTARGHAFSEQDLEFLVLSLMNCSNAFIAEKVDKLPTVEGRKSIGGRYVMWSERWENGRAELSHTARLIDVQEVKHG